MRIHALQPTCTARINNTSASTFSQLYRLSALQLQRILTYIWIYARKAALASTWGMNLIQDALIWIIHNGWHLINIHRRALCSSYNSVRSPITALFCCGDLRVLSTSITHQCKLIALCPASDLPFGTMFVFNVYILFSNDSTECAFSTVDLFGSVCM